jgi:hypothetical protein
VSQGDAPPGRADPVLDRVGVGPSWPVGLEMADGAQDTGSRSAEGHSPGLDEPSLWVVLPWPWSVGALGCAAAVGAGGGTAAAATLGLGAEVAVPASVSTRGAARSRRC